MKRGVTYIFTLVSIVLLYFGSLYIVSRRPSIDCLDPLQKSDILNRESVEAAGVQVPLVNEDGLGEPTLQLFDEDTIVQDEEEEEKPITEIYGKSCQNILSSLAAARKNKEKAVIVALVRNSEIGAMRRTMRDFEDRFNRKYNYPYVFLNDEPFSEEFKGAVSAMTNAETKFGLVPESMWSVPKHVNQTVMNQQLSDYAARGVMYGGSLSYRHMCRFNSGFFYRHPLLDEYDYYWRIEPGVSFYCDLDYDPFHFMKENGKEYGFTITLKEIPETIPTLWEHTMKFAQQHELNTTLLRFFGDPKQGYNLCHYWSNFEIASLNLWRDERYQAYFDYLDKTGNFFYERWGDAIVHSLAAGLFLNKNQVHFFNDIGYRHDHFTHCINDGDLGRCMCPESFQNADTMWGSCLASWKDYPEEGLQWNFKANGKHEGKFDQPAVIPHGNADIELQ
ncbi:alpha 1,2-mannosyltransferase 2.4.1 [Rhizopus stolonifer]|uniref:Alpha 1,2-mannosyltransferase 2.4.1 n=1 Tax=Rhizopus stolonifer TaxID=4846 RepID=A0A367KFG4_RHIST|nr:alpha 1,2-mannosyltransferase 2.4.1 [Rhizopus stolonifer]